MAQDRFDALLDRFRSSGWHHRVGLVETMAKHRRLIETIAIHRRGILRRHVSGVMAHNVFPAMLAHKKDLYKIIVFFLFSCPCPEI